MKIYRKKRLQNLICKELQPVAILKGSKNTTLSRWKQSVTVIRGRSTIQSNYTIVRCKLIVDVTWFPCTSRPTLVVHSVLSQSIKLTTDIRCLLLQSVYKLYLCNWRRLVVDRREQEKIGGFAIIYRATLVSASRSRILVPQQQQQQENSMD